MQFNSTRPSAHDWNGQKAEPVEQHVENFRRAVVQIFLEKGDANLNFLCNHINKVNCPIKAKSFGVDSAGIGTQPNPKADPTYIQPMIGRGLG